MNKPYDATMKALLDAFASDWIEWLAPAVGLPGTVGVVSVDTDMSTVQFTADKVFRLLPPATGLLHIEPQSSHDLTLAPRLLVYNAIICEKYGGPVYTVVLLLRSEAVTSNLTGLVVGHFADGREYLHFEYSVVRVWELPVEPLLTGPLGSLPLALLTDEAAGKVQELLIRIDERFEAEQVATNIRDLLLTSSYILLGLRYGKEYIREAFKKVNSMRESTTYQAILEEGREEGREQGRLESRHEDLLAVLRERFEHVPNEMEFQIREMTGVDQLQLALRLAVRVSTLDQFKL